MNLDGSGNAIQATTETQKFHLCVCLVWVAHGLIKHPVRPLLPGILVGPSGENRQTSLSSGFPCLKPEDVCEDKKGQYMYSLEPSGCSKQPFPQL